MVEVIGVRFRCDNRLNFFNTQGLKYSKGDMVVTESRKGLNCGKVEVSNRILKDESMLPSFNKVVRLANSKDLKKLQQNKLREQEAKKVFQKKLKVHQLEMKLVDVECTFAGNKIIFYFTADGRVDFRNLVKDLAYVLHTRIELRQIGVRDETKIIGGLGFCGKPFCCSTFLDDFHSVSIKMAKEQGISLNPTKISGLCGRLMCCLKFEHFVYSDLLKNSIKVGSIVQTPNGKGTVIENNLIAQKVLVKLEENPDSMPINFKMTDVSVIEPGKD